MLLCKICKNYVCMVYMTKFQFVKIIMSTCIIMSHVHDVYGCQIYIWIMRHEQSTGDDLSIQSMKLQAVKYESFIMNNANIEYINDE